MSRRFRLFSIQLTAFVWLLSILCFIPTLQAQSAGDFTVVVLPDTQYYSQSYPQIFNSQTQWIASNAAAQNIKLVIGEGDIVNVSSNATQWANAVHSIGILDQAQMPYALAIGNHDYNTLPPTNRQATLFNQYFGPSRYSGKPYYGTTNYPSGSNENFYETFTWGGKNYLILVLEFVPRGGAVAWAKSVLSSNSDKEVIVVTHSYLYSDGTTVDQCDTSDMVGDNNGAMLWSNLISQYPNISVVLNGHITNKFSARRSDIGVNGNFVHQIFANWQDWTNGGNGYLRIMRFSPSNNSIQVQSFSPYTGLFLTDAANQFTLKWHNDGAPGTGTAVVTGRVRTNGYGLGCSAIPGATINVGGTTATADANGYYSVSVAPGQFSATGAASAYQTATQTATLNDHFPNELDFFLTPVPPCAQNPTDPSVTICTPKNGASVTSPMNVVAGTNSSSPIVALSVWLDGSKVFSTGQSLLNTSVAAAPGNHLLAVQGQNGAKQTFTQTISVTAPGGVTCQPLATVPSENICTPVNNATVSSPIMVQSAARMANAIKYSQIWLDGVMKYQVASASINTSLSATAGTHRLTVQSADSTNVITKQTIYVTVPSTSPSCTPGATDPSVTICAPAANATVKSPVNIIAASRDSASAVTNMFIWVDGVKQWNGTGSSVNTSLALATGTHRVTVQAKDAAAHYFQSTVTINVQ
jgi:hypothetical protein